ncbi:hypothetical protein OJF2_10460 [Aquisphaera giovannonii]|uniref:Uncharacterized protein n=1 Tax=Aquisphaera giovannonii TaxID=406548 RepID=A0A5B9VWU1_9BACT|nr:hypothetical protein [Aquisphaera giovannonii]QEH32569.1 hypothetical protein OJF2_10460 [Aquisphaera giovannonii]
MASCDYCGTSILFGGTRSGDLRFCSQKCAANVPLLRASRAIPEDAVDRLAGEIHRGQCPKCGGPGPVDLHTSHRVYSALAFTSWSSHPEMCCPSCARKKFLKHGAFSLVLGWWGFPFGLIMTPIQVLRNAGGLLGIGEPARDVPSDKLKRMARISLGAQRRAQIEAAGIPPTWSPEGP